MNKRKTLIIAYACEPNQTSEPGVGWFFTQEISKSINTTVLTRRNNKSIIEKEETNNINFIYYDLPSFFTKIKKKLPLGTQLYYFLWQWGAYFYLRNFIKKSNFNFDIIHHLNFSISWLTPPSFLLNSPLVWGPIGGGDFIPLQFLRRMKFISILNECFYYLINQLNKFSPFSFLIRKSMSALIFRTESAKKSYNFKKKDIIYGVISETAFSGNIFKKEKLDSSFINAICVGRMTYWKGFLLAVKGFHMFLDNGGNGRLELYGNGPEFKVIEDYIKKNHLEKKILLKGFVDNDVINESLKKSTILIHPSFRDGGSWSVMEAMSNGLPVICLDTSGIKDMVSEECGILIDLISPKQVIKDIKEGLHMLQNSPIIYRKMSNNAQNRIKTEYNWTKRGDQIMSVYDKI